MRINDTSTINLGHHDVHEIIMSCANNFVFGIKRKGVESDSEDDFEVEPSIQTNGEFNAHTNGEVNDEQNIHSNDIPSGDTNATVIYEPVDEQTLFERIQSPASQTQSEGSGNTVQSNSVDSISSVIPRKHLGPVPYTNGFKKPEKDVENVPDELELQIAEIMSGEAEVLKEHNNVIG